MHQPGPKLKSGTETEPSAEGSGLSPGFIIVTKNTSQTADHRQNTPTQDTPQQEYTQTRERSNTSNVQMFLDCNIPTVPKAIAYRKKGGKAAKYVCIN